MYTEGRGYNHSSFWRENVPSKDVHDLLCENFVSRFKARLGIDLYENDFSRTKGDDEMDMSLCAPESDYSKDIDKVNSTMEADPEWDGEFDCESTKPDPNVCCASCVCHKNKMFWLDKSEPCDEAEYADVVSIRKAENTDLAGYRITQIAAILRNLSFEPGNAVIMALNSAIQR